ncbi:MAG TPA: glycosyltransferase family 39 protein, partial [Bryobacteraceae bacterium]|nr:glycosyltransferase family 39 protein [Bryobacteraceae bacterium]
GHPHPPFNAWFLGLLLATFKDFYGGRFHFAYILFSFIATASVWSLARRFSPHPVWATLLFCVTPAFVINGTSFETDVPHMALFVASVALFVRAIDERSRRLLFLSTIPMVCAALTALQAAALVPILWLYLWLHDRRNKLAYAVALTPIVTIAAFQIFERATTGTVPAAILTGYLSSYGFQQLQNKLLNAAALTVHLGWIVFPVLWILYLRARRSAKEPFLEGWLAIYFLAAVALFFAGSARYLLPIAAPAAILVSRQSRLLPVAFFSYLVLSLALGVCNFWHWESYRRFALDLRSKMPERTWVNSEWGLRFYLEDGGALPARRSQALHPGEMMVTSKLGYPVPITTGGGRLTPYASLTVHPILPLQIIGMHAHSGYSTASKGLLPFDITWAPIDEVEASVISKVDPKLSQLPMNAPEAPEQLVSGFFDLEEKRWRWMSGQGVALLKEPPQPAKVFAEFYIPDVAPGRRVQILLDKKKVAERTYDAPGQYVLESAQPVTGSTLSLEIDQTFSPPGDNRQLGMIVTALGFRE